jgi:DNA-binding transcriptional MerR regulator
MDHYITSSVAQLFGVTAQTVKNWAHEFEAYLSPTATPPKGGRRSFTREDLQVFTLVRDYSQRGLGYADAHVALRAGQRGEVPDSSVLTTSEPPQLITLLRAELATRDQLIENLKSERDMERGKVELLERQLEQKETSIRGLYEELAQLKARREGTSGA